MTTRKEQVRDHGSGTRRAGPDRPTLRFFVLADLGTVTTG